MDADAIGTEFLVSFGDPIVVPAWCIVMKPSPSSVYPGSESAHAVAFCLNCNDMEDLATSEETHDLARLRRRFTTCREEGRFDGDVCARLYVADDIIDEPSLFADADEEFSSAS